MICGQISALQLSFCYLKMDKCFFFHACMFVNSIELPGALPLDPLTGRFPLTPTGRGRGRGSKGNGLETGGGHRRKEGRAIGGRLGKKQ